MKQTYPTQEVLAYAFAAFRIRGGYVKHTQRYSTEGKPAEHSNGEMVKQHFGGYTDPDFVDFTTIEEDYENVELARSHSRRYTLGLIGGQLNSFQQDIFSAVSNDEITSKQLGLVAYVPALVVREIADAKFKKMLRIEYRNSKDIGQPKDVVDGVIKFLSKFWSEQWESFNYIADYDGNLVSFMNKFDHEVGTRKRIKGKVKAHGKNRSFDVCETRLNYVKLLKV